MTGFEPFDPTVIAERMNDADKLIDLGIQPLPCPPLSVTLSMDDEATAPRRCHVEPCSHAPGRSGYCFWHDR